METAGIRLRENRRYTGGRAQNIAKDSFLCRICMRKKGVNLEKEPKKQPTNRKHKDRLFRLVFHEKKYQLELYNALNGTDYTDPEVLEETTLEDAIFLGVKNDLSFIIGMSLNMYEHQSSKNLNMPLRGLIYFSQVYQTYVRSNGYNLYAESQIPLPFPNYIVFYNGMKDMADEEEMLLSEAFPEELKEQIPALECRVRLLNINAGHNAELMEKCRRLKEYAEFVALIRENIAQGVDVHEAIHMAMGQAMKKGLLADVLSRCETEVTTMLLEEFDMEEVKACWKKEAAEEATQRTSVRDGKLFSLLLTQKKYDEAERAATDSGYRTKLFEMYGI